jgi:hypothetical protein
MIINKLKLIMSILIVVLLTYSCIPKEKRDVPEYIYTNLSNGKQIKLYHYTSFIELSGIFCDFFENYEKNKESYSLLMKKLDKKNWKFEFISLEYESKCFNDSLFVQFKKLNQDVLGKKLKSITFEEEIVVIRLHMKND